MTYSNSYVAVVKDSNQKVLREIGGQVFLPFQSEYSLLLKNNNWHRSLCKVEIDGTDVLGGHGLIIGNHSSVDLERFIVDGDMSGGQRFKFVPLGDSRVNDPSNSENGIVVVKFWKEVDPPINLNIYNNTVRGNNTGNPPPHDSFYYSAGTGDIIGGTTTSNASLASFSCCLDSMDMQSAQAGATVEGSHSDQKFTTGEFRGEDGAPTVLRLKLVGRKASLTVTGTKKKFCVRCGAGASFTDKFCRGCGSKLKNLV